MKLLRLRRSVVAVALIMGLAVSIVWPTFASVSNETDGTWMGGVTLKKLSGISAADRLAAQTPDCTGTTLNVLRLQPSGSVAKVSEAHCMVSTLAGLMDTNGELIVPHGFSTAYPIKNYSAFSRGFVPVPGQAAVLAVAGDPSWPGANLGVYRNFYDHLKINVLNGYFELHDNPDVLFKYATGRNMSFNISGLRSFSGDGRYLVTDAVYEGLMRIDLLTLQTIPFEQTLPRANNVGLLSAASDITSDGRYVAVGYGGGWGDPFLRVYDITDCTNPIQAVDAYSVASIACPKKDLRSTLLTQDANINNTDGVRFTSDHTLLLDTYNKDQTFSRYQALPAGAQEHKVQYVAMGDSFSSGEGTFNYRAGTDTSLNKCHQSALSYPYLLASTLDSFVSVACSGATTDNIFPNNKEHKDTQLNISDSEVTIAMQAEALASHSVGTLTQGKFLQQDDPEIVTISIGGNDIQFSGILKRCVLPFAGDITPNTDCYASYEDRLEVVNEVNAQFDNLYRTYVNLKGEGERRVYIIGYPQIASTTGSCALNVRLSQADREFGAELVTYLNSVIKQAAAKAGVYYVDTEHAFDGHKLCDGTAATAVNGLTAGNDTALHTLGNESYHPNELGHQLLADAIAHTTNNLTAPMPQANSSLTIPAVNDGLPILQAPKAQRPINEVLHSENDFTRQVQSGQAATYDYTEFNRYLAPNTTGTISLHSSPTDLGSVHVDANGEIHVSLTIPAGTLPGLHTIHMYVTNIAGQPVDIQTMVYVTANANDLDGDGLLNDVDSCADIPNSGVDADKDGVDDVCDVEVVPLPLSSDTNDPDGSQASESTEDANQSSEENTAAGQGQGPTPGTSLPVSTTEQITNTEVITDFPATVTPQPAIIADSVQSNTSFMAMQVGNVASVQVPVQYRATKQSEPEVLSVPQAASTDASESSVEVANVLGASTQQSTNDNLPSTTATFAARMNSHSTTGFSRYPVLFLGSLLTILLLLIAVRRRHIAR